VILIALLQYPLWLGKGSWLRVWELNRKVAEQQEKNTALKARNDALNAEVTDLKSGRAAIEERARSELGMIKQDEVFFQVVDTPPPESLPALNPALTPSSIKPSVAKPAIPKTNGAVTKQTPKP